MLLMAIIVYNDYIYLQCPNEDTKINTKERVVYPYRKRN